MACCDNYNLMSGLGACCESCAYGGECEGLSGLSGLGMLGEVTGDIWPGDPFTFAVQVNTLQNPNSYFQQLFADPMNESGQFYDCVAYSNAGYLHAYVTVTGKVNQYFASKDDLQAAIVPFFYVSAGYGLLDIQPDLATAQLDVAVHETLPSGEPNPIPTRSFTPSLLNQANPVVALPKPKCAGTIDQWLVNAGLKNTCDESVLGFKSGAALAVAIIGGLLIIPPLIKKL